MRLLTASDFVIADSGTKILPHRIQPQFDKKDTINFINDIEFR